MFYFDKSRNRKLNSDFLEVSQEKSLLSRVIQYSLTKIIFYLKERLCIPSYSRKTVIFQVARISKVRSIDAKLNLARFRLSIINLKFSKIVTISYCSNFSIFSNHNRRIFKAFTLSIIR